MVREIAALGGDVSAFVPKPVAERIRERVVGRADQASVKEGKNGKQGK
jgi:hypothetical protein